MLPDLLLPFAEDYKILNLFRYITFRSGGAFMTALLISLCCGERFIAWLKTHQAQGQPIRQDGPESHILAKAGTPTMGGLLILSVLFLPPCYGCHFLMPIYGRYCWWQLPLA